MTWGRLSLLRTTPLAASLADGLTGTTPFTFTVTRSGDNSQAATLNFAVQGSGSNPAPSSLFAATSGTVDFAAGATSAVVTVNVIGASLTAPETFTTTISGPAGVSITTNAATGTILPPVSNEPYVSYVDTTTGTSGQVQMVAGGNGGPSYLQHTYIWDKADGVAMRADAANSFIHGGPGQDALQVTSGTNVLDGGTGSNFMTGTVAGAGTDTFFTDARSSQVVWNTLINFHQGDAATLWGFDPSVSSYRWDDNPSGAVGATGATLRANIVGGAGRSGDGVDASITFAGLTVAQAKAMVHTTGTQAAGNYLYFYNQGV